MSTIAHTEVDSLALEVDAADTSIADDVLFFMAGTRGGVTLRVIQSLLSFVAVCTIYSAGDHTDSVIFKLFVGILVFQIVYSFFAGAADMHALFAPMHVHCPQLLWVWTVGDLIMLHLVSWASLMVYGFIQLLDVDFAFCPQTHCPTYRVAAAMALVTSSIFGLTFLQNFRFLVYRSL